MYYQLREQLQNERGRTDELRKECDCLTKTSKNIIFSQTDLVETSVLILSFIKNKY
jgi:hypothetical protein